MRLDELYPYWRDVQEELREAVCPLTAAQIEARPRDSAPSIRDLALAFLYYERYWVSHLVAGNAYEKPRPDLYPDGQALVEGLTAARQVTAMVLEPFSREGLRAVRRVPADPSDNRPETNMPVDLLFWHVLEREIFTWGQITLRMSDSAPGPATENMNDDVILADYDPRWPALFVAEAARIGSVLRSDLVTAVEHFGSTAIPGLAAKPIIDILVGVRSLSAARAEAVPALKTMGYAFWDDNPDLEHLFFVKGLPPNGPRTYHIHIVQPDAEDSKHTGGLFWDRLLFRDYLRTHQDEAGRYGALKRELASRFPDDREAYTDAKGDYVRDITARARRQSDYG